MASPAGHRTGLVALVAAGSREEASAWSRVLEDRGARCLLATADEWPASTPVDLAVVAAGQVASGYARRAAAFAGQSPPRLVLVARGGAGASGLGAARIDAVTLDPIDRAALLAAAGLLAQGAVEPAGALAELLTTSALGPIARTNLTAVARQVCRSFRADRVSIQIGRQRPVLSDGATGTAEDPALRDLALLAARTHAPVVLAAATGSPRTITAASITSRTHGRIGVLACSWARFRSPALDELAALEALAGRLATELVWSAAQRRVSSELDLTRAAGAIDVRLGVWNRAAFDRLVAMRLSAQARSSHPVALAVVDACGMTALNAAHGHAFGDQVLRRLAEQCVSSLRGHDLIAHYTEDKLAVLVDTASIDHAQLALMRVHEALRRRPLQAPDGTSVKIAFTGGVLLLEPERPLAEALAEASGLARRAQRERRPIVAATDPDAARVADTLADAAAPASPADDDLVRGRVLAGTYRLLHAISSGGIGVVYRAEDLALRRSVAVKLLRPERARDESMVQRFGEEAALLASLRHPNVVQVFAAGVDEGTPYFVMEIVPGEPMDLAIAGARKAGGWLAASRVLTVLRDTAAALDALHLVGLIHRDVKPGNLIHDPFAGRAVLIDVGIAARRGAKGDVAGTPGYVAPEVLATGEHTRSTDVYGLAVTAYELLTLALPWPPAESPLALLQSQLDDRWRPASALRPELAPLDDILQRGMSREPAGRWASAGELVGALGRAVTTLFGRDDAPAPPRVARTEVGDPWSEPEDLESSRLPLTRGLVFRQVAHILVPRLASAWRLQLSARDPRLVELASPETKPLAWLPAEHLIAMLDTPPPGWSSHAFAAELGRSAVRTTFRRFFPTSTATMSPSSTLACLQAIWSNYQSWGTLEASVDGHSACRVHLQSSLAHPALCAWIGGLLEQLVTLSGGTETRVTESACAVRGDRGCSFELRWTTVGFRDGALRSSPASTGRRGQAR